MTDQGRIERARARYEAAAHRVQSAIAFMPADQGLLSPKHMRVGVDMSKSDMGGLARLLIAKGVFTIEEYHEAMADAAESEAQGYADLLSSRFGINVDTI